MKINIFIDDRREAFLLTTWKHHPVSGCGGSILSKSFWLTMENFPLRSSILSLLTLRLGISRSGSRLKKASRSCLHASSGRLALGVLFRSMHERSVSVFIGLIAEMRVDVLRIFIARSKGPILKKNVGCWSLVSENSGIALVSLSKGLELDRNHLSALM